MKNLASPTKAVFAAFFLFLIFWAFRFHGRLPAITDLFLYTYPSQAVNLQEWAKGRIPLWNAAIGCGTPQLASGLAAVFYPPFWVWGLTGLSHWLAWMSLLHCLFAFLGFYFWARSQKVYSLWAVLGALSFAGSLHMVRCWGYPVFCAAQSWTPWIFWIAAYWLEGGRIRWWLGLSVAIALQLLAGYPFFTFYTLAFLFIWALSQTRGRGKKIVLFLTAPTALGLAAVHSLPFLDALTYSTRGSWGSVEQFPYFTRGAEVLTLLNPTLLGDPGTSAYGGQEANAAFLLYFGIIPLAAWAIGSLVVKFEGRVFWGLSSLAWLFWMMGFLRMMPEGWLEMLDPSKAVGVFLFAALTCAGLALTRFFRDRPEGKPKTAALWAITGLWTLDLLSVPFRTVHPVPDSYQKPSLQAWAERVGQATQGQRVLGFKTHRDATADGAGNDAFEKAADDWVGEILANSPAVWGLRGSQVYASTWTMSMDKFWKAFNKIENYQGDLADVAGLRLLYLPVTLASPHYQDLGEKEGGHLLSNNQCRGEAWPAQDLRIFPNQDAILSELCGKSPEVEKGEEIYREAEGPQLPAPSRSLVLPTDTPPQGLSRPYGSQAFYQGDFSKGGWLVWNEAFTPGWKAWVDGHPAPIQRTFGFFMGVFARPGEHRVDFRYEPTAFRLGLFLTFLFMGASLAGFFLARPKTPPPVEGPPIL